MASLRRDHLVETALALFSRHGYHATGIDRILAESGVAKMTLYKHFRSKDDLILAALRRRDEEFFRWLQTEVEGRAATPRERLLTVFDALESWFKDPAFNGCCFINAAGEYGGKDDPVHVAAAEHKARIAGYLRELAQAAGAASPDEVARQLMLLVNGAIVAAHVGGDAGAARSARALAEALLVGSLQKAVAA
ncbi:MAG: TetR/AcrR family transcriptional regulator [Gemmatimonas sp.]